MIAPGTTVGPYRLATRLGRGAVGEVWRAEADGSAVPLALKLVGVADRARRTALLTEVRAASRLDHPNVLALLDFGEVPSADGIHGPVAYLASELCSGDLRDLPSLDWPAVHGLVTQLLRGLAHAHARSVVHRDLKPANVLFRQAGPQLSWRIADLGIALLGRGATGDRPTSGSTGTPLYMAPEQVEGRWRDQGPWTDLYALGCIVHELVSGVHPLAGLGRLEILARQRLADLPDLPATPQHPDGLSRWVARLLHRDPELRFRRAADALAAWLALDPERPAPPLGERRLPSVPGAGLSLVPFRRPAFAGREAEQDALLALAQGSGLRVAWITGPSGSGKSQLARSAAERLHEEGAAVLQATFGEGGGPHDGLRAMLERELCARDLGPDELLARFGRRLGADDARDLTALLRPEADLGVRLVGASEQFAAVRATLAAEARDRPVVLWLDDLQWGTEGLEFLRWLRNHPLSILVLGTVREEALVDRPELAALLAEIDGVHLRLGPLAPDDVDTLVRSLVALSPRSLSVLTDRVGGNPLFAVQVVTDWAARGQLAPGPDGFEVAADAPLPSDVQTTWGSRLSETLGSSDPRALELAAILGLRVDPGEWERACRAAGVADREAVEEIALRAGLLAREASGERVFVHGMLREVLRAQARAEGRLPALAAACAEALETNADPLRLGRLLAQGDAPARALPYLRRAAILLSQHGRTREVPAVYAEHEAARPADDLRSLAELRVIETRFWIQRGDLSRAEDRVAEAEAAAEQHGWDDVLGDVRCALSTLHRARGRRPLSAACAADARDRFLRLGDPVGVARATALLADVEDDPVRAAALAEAALAALEARGVRSGALYANLLLRLGNTRRNLGEVDAAAQFYERARVQYAELGDRASLGQTVAALASIRFERGDVAGARAWRDEALRLLNRVDSPRALAMVEAFAAEMALVEGDLDRAEALARSVSDRTHRAGLRNRFNGETVLAAIRLRTGRISEARALIDRVRRLAGTDLAPELAVLLDALELSFAADRGDYRARLIGVQARSGGVVGGVFDYVIALGAETARARGW